MPSIIFSCLLPFFDNLSLSISISNEGFKRAKNGDHFQEQGELEFRRGDVLTVTDRSDQHWWTGELGNRRGLFPATYVTPYQH